jgi:glycosyltransferase involved in cell wall biosynthesis
MELTVCICTHDRPTYVRDCLEGLRLQTAAAERFEVLLVDSASSAPTARQLSHFVAAFGVRLVRLDRPGVALARDAGARAARAPFIAYIDDDAIPAPDWVATILRVLDDASPRPALLGGRILPRWEAPLPRWWPASLRGVLSIIEHQGQGEYRSAALPPGLEPYAANMVVDVAALRSVGGFGDDLGRHGGVLLSDEEVRLAWALQDAGHRIIYDSRLVVYHQIQAGRLNPAWLLRRLYWQGASTVVTRRLTGQARAVWRELPRRLAVLALLGAAALVPHTSAWLIGARWRVAYAAGFVRAALGWQAVRSARRQGGALAAAGRPA